jgi:bifunctional non-homologous end joining protein LigD
MVHDRSRSRAAAVPNKLAKYQSMRDFAVSAEPSGVRAATTGHRYVIQKHAARRLHYDFRLELDGVLLSWSVPKGPSLKPATRRLAVRTEDHPLDYVDFEGIIPAGQYGGGTVVVWDHGTWTPEGDARAGMKQGRLTFTLAGEKLRGRWHLVRTKPQGKQDSWLLFKGRDDEANDTLDIVTERPESVVSGRTVEQIAKAPERVWQSNHAHAAPPEDAGTRAPANPNDLLMQLPLGFKLTNLDKVLYPEQGITKGQLVAYLTVVADRMLPFVANRPLTLVRCPEGRGKPCFFQKHALKGAPSAIHRVPIADASGDVERYMSIDDLPGLVATAQLGTLELHTWGSHAGDVEHPDLMVFDLDPDEGLAWDEVALAAIELRGRLHALGLTSFVKTTGGKGLHVVVPVNRKLDWDDHKQFTKLVCETVEAAAPTRFTTNMAKRARRNKIFLDYLRNGRGATFVAPYSPRAREGATVSVPISWDELAGGIDPLAFTTTTVPKRLAALTIDPWHALTTTKQGVTAAAWRAVRTRKQRA